MANETTGGKKARSIMKASRLLQSQVGAGKIKPEKIEKAQSRVEAVRGRIDLKPFADEHMADIKTCMGRLKAGDSVMDVTDEIARSIMKFKGNIGIFSDGPFISLAILMLNWVESVEEIDQDVMDVLHGYYVTLDQIFSGKLHDKKMIEVIIREMESACQRYFSKHPELQLTQVIDNSKAFYVDQSDNKNVTVGLGFDDDMHDANLIGHDD